MVDQSQANPKVHPVDYAALIFVLIGAAAEMADKLPPKFSSVLVALAIAARVYTKWLGSQQEQDGLAEGRQVGAELKESVDVLTAKKADPVNDPAKP